MKKLLSLIMAVVTAATLITATLAAAAADDGAVTEPYIIGDADSDTKVTILDATAIQRSLASLPNEVFCERAADADIDGQVTILDATEIQRFLASLPTVCQAIGEPVSPGLPQEEPDTGGDPATPDHTLPGSDPTDSPADDPTEAPVVDPTDVPAVDPTDAPVVDPTDAPVVDPTDVPVLPTEAPTGEPGDPYNNPGRESTPYDGEEWLDKSTITPVNETTEDDLEITAIFSDCFFAQNVIPLPVVYKINGQLPAEYCVGDRILCSYTNTYYDNETDRIEGDLEFVAWSEFVPDPDVAYKPVIYLYPEQETDVSVRLNLDGALTCTYPAYRGGWQVTAAPDGTLTDSSGMSYNYLYWEGRLHAQYDFSQGFCVKGSDTAAFLEQALAQLGLTRREANEFIVFWLPLMQQNPYNVIAFQTDAYTDKAQLEITPAPDTLIRVFMAWYPSDKAVAIPAQTLSAPARTGFTAVEWGGASIGTR